MEGLGTTSDEEEFPELVAVLVADEVELGATSI
jgi:hypothetical protein